MRPMGTDCLCRGLHLLQSPDLLLAPLKEQRDALQNCDVHEPTKLASSRGHRVVCSSRQAETDQLTSPLALNPNFYISNCIKHNSNNFSHVQPARFARPAKLHPTSDSADKPRAVKTLSQAVLWSCLTQRLPAVFLNNISCTHRSLPLEFLPPPPFCPRNRVGW